MDLSLGLSADEAHRLLTALSLAGLNEQAGRNVLNDPVLARSMVQGYRQELARRAEHERFQRFLFTPPKYQLKTVRKWATEQRWSSLTHADFHAAEDAMPAIPTAYLHCVVLVPYLKTEHETCDALWKLAASRHQNATRYEEDPPDPYDSEDEGTRYRVRLRDGESHMPGLRWEHLNVGALIGAYPCVRLAYGMRPQAAILAAAALHPQWVASMDGKRVPNVWLPGYEVVGGDRGSRMPILERSGSTIMFGHDLDQEGKPSVAVPSYTERPRTLLRVAASRSFASASG